ncbi:prepilin peptidase [Iodidimonas sp. SYSU 1G8]|uniref:A24 family peptidase n=1 Tax=Iodidimonas sp. SYSU 1G8 TaxID=3133967 RepID=UPI0031FE7989
MSGIGSAQLVLLTAFLGVLVCCAIEDCRSRNISHWAILSIAALYIPYAAAGFASWQSGLIAGAIFLVAGFVFFGLKVMGGGDSKMIAAVGLWVGTGQIDVFVFYTAIAGAAVAVTILAALRLGLPTQSASAVPETARTVPYGIAIAFGSVVAVGQTVLEKAN